MPFGQLHLSWFEWPEPSAHAVVYDLSRLIPMDPTRFFIDAKPTASWRAEDL